MFNTSKCANFGTPCMYTYTKCPIKKICEILKNVSNKRGMISKGTFFDHVVLLQLGKIKFFLRFRGKIAIKDLFAGSC